MLRLTGSIKAIEPITVSYPGKEQCIPKTPNGAAMLNGSTFRGPLRKATYHAIRQLLADHHGVAESEIFSLTDAYMLGQGMDTTREANNEGQKTARPLAETRLRQANPMLNLFGRWGLSGYLATSPLIAAADSVMTVGQSVRADMFERDTEEVRYLSEADYQKLQAQMDSERETQNRITETRKKIKQLRSQFVHAESAEQRKQLNDQISELETRIKSIKSEREGSEESIKHVLDGYEAIAPGTLLSHEMTLTEDDDASLGLLLIGLSEMARNPVLGGHQSNGCGRFEAEWTAWRWPVGALEAETVGSVAIEANRFSMTGETIEQARQRCIDALPTFDFIKHMLSEFEN